MDIEPKIYRDIVIDWSMTLHQLHLLIQSIFGFQNYHMWHFGNYDHRIGKTKTIDQLIESGCMEWWYTYDYGDNREMKIKINRKLKIDETRKTPYVLKYQWPMLIEDTWWPWWYSDLLVAYQTQDKKYLDDIWRDDEEWLKNIMDTVFEPVMNDKDYEFTIP